VGVAALIATLRPRWRIPGLGHAAVVAAPFGLMLAVALQWALWLPHVVVDGLGIRAALAASRRTYRTQRRQIAVPVAAFVVMLLVAAAGMAGLGWAGITPSVVALASAALTVLATVFGAILVTILHEIHTGIEPRFVAQPRWSRPRVWRLRPAVAVGLALAVTIPSVLNPVGTAVAAGAPPAIAVNSLDDDPHGDHDAECTHGAPCTLRGAIARAATAPGTQITFAVSGTIELTDTIVVAEPVTIDGLGQRITLRAPGSDTASSPVALSVYNYGAEPVVIRNITVVGAEADTSRGLTVGGHGPVVVDSVTFTRLRTSTSRGSAIYNDGNLLVRNATFAHNDGFVGAGTVYNIDRLEVVNSTFLHNGTSGIVSERFGPSIVNSVFLTTAMGAFNCDIRGTVQTASGNLSSDFSCVGQDGEGANLGEAELGLGEGKNVIPQSSFEVGLHFRQVIERAITVGMQQRRVMEKM